jgi:dTDP-4-amino-4,6-dideoxygalactose transaminase
MTPTAPGVRCFKPSLTGEEARAVAEAFASGWTGTGIYTRLFEERLGAAIGARRLLSTNSGTAALHLALKALDVTGGEVVVTPVTSVATGNAVLYNGAKPVFCDVEEDTGNIDARLLPALLTRRTRAIVVVHLGSACDMDAILKIARARKIPVVEDACACHPLGGSHRGRPLGTMGAMGAFSFGRFKGLTTVDGGAVVCGRAGLRPRLEALRRLGHKQDGEGLAGGEGGVEELGFHCRMNDVAAAIGLAQLKRWDEISARLSAVERRYRAGLDGLPFLRWPAVRPYSLGVRGPLAVRILDGRRAALRAALRRAGIQTEDGLTPLHLYRLYRPFRRPLPAAERFCEEWQPLPFYPDLRERDVDRIADAVRRFK